MPTVPLLPNEQMRLAELRRYAVLDTPPEAAFERITSLTARFFHAPMAIITFVDECRQWNKACFGFVGSEIPLGDSFCAHAILQDGVFEVPDTLADERFADFPSVAAQPHLRFYAGAPLTTPAGYRLGTLCVADTTERPTLTAPERQTLVDLAQIVVDELELRLALRESQQLQVKQKVDQAHIASIYEATQIGLCSVDEDGRFVSANKAYCDMYGFDQHEIVGQLFFGIAPTPEGAQVAFKHHRDFLFGNAPYPKEWRVKRNDGHEFDIWVTAARVEQPGGKFHRVSTVTNITDIRSLEHERTHLASLIDEVSDAVISTDLNLTIQSWNRGAEKLYGYVAEEVIGTKIDNCIKINFSDESEDQAKDKLLSQGRWSGEVEQRGKDDRVVSVLSSVTLIHGSHGQPTGVVAVNRDLSETKSLSKQLHHQAHHDNLTGLPNRLLMLDRLEQARGSTRQDGQAMAFFLVDVDNFKTLNDTYGHIFGDRLLSSVGNKLRSCVRQGDTVARWGGDEFAILVGGLRSSSEAKRIADAIVTEFSTPIEIGERKLCVTLSVGIDVHVNETSTGDPYHNADLALYQAKFEGRDTYRFFTQELYEQFVGRHHKEVAIKNAVENREFVLHYQPRVNLVSGEIESLEALVRWPQADGTLVPPNAFVPIAEDVGLIVALGELTLKMAISQAVLWCAQGTPKRVAVNLSAKQLKHPSLVATVVELLNHYRLDARWLELEITESIFVDDTDESLVKLQALRELGVYISMDDFGTGYSSLSYLKRLPLDSLKIDRTFVAGLEGLDVTHKDARIVQTIVTLGQTLGLVVVAEGVETVSQQHLLQKLGCQHAQGFLFFKPLPADEIGAVLEGSATIKTLYVAS